jgi:AraC-like DNA-binding protein
MAVDPLSDLLTTVRLTGAVFFEVAAGDSWAIGSPSPDIILPLILPGADHLIAYHVVTEGRCVATSPGMPPIPLQAGEVIVFTRSQWHVMSSHASMRDDPPAADVVHLAATARKPFCINLGEGAVSARLVCGYLACDARPFNPLLENLPPVMTMRGQGDKAAGGINQFIRFAVAEAAENRAGRDSVLTKLSELMFIDVVRRHLETLPPDQGGWLAGLRDPFIGKALSLLHGNPAHGWTIAELAKRTGLSRSALAERFARTVGQPPMHYLTRWRMQIASELLTGGVANIAGIAAATGYESEAAFSRAFKKMIGVTPSAWRRDAR